MLSSQDTCFERPKPFNETLSSAIQVGKFIVSSQPSQKLWRENMKTLKSTSRVGTSLMLACLDGTIDAHRTPWKLLKHSAQQPPDVLSS